MPHLQLFHLPGACSRVTLGGLIMTGASFEVVVPPLHRGGLTDPAFRARNPLGQVPTLLIDGQALTENVAILATLNQLFPGKGLLPSGDSRLEALGLSRLAFCASQLHPIATRIFFPERFCDLSAEASERVREQAVAMLAARLSGVELQLRDTSWWLGEAFSIADLYLVWITGRMRRLNVALPPMPGIETHVERVWGTGLYRDLISREQGFLEKLEADGAAFPPPIRISMIG